MRIQLDNWTFEFFRKELEKMGTKLDQIISKENKIMSDVSEKTAAINAALDKLATDILAEIAALKAKGVSAEDLAGMDAIVTKVQGLDTQAQTEGA